MDWKFDLGLFWDGLTTGLNGVLAVGLLLIAWLLGRMKVVAERRTEASLDKFIDRWAVSWRRWRAKSKARKAAKNERERLARLEADRVGRKFLWRASAKDPGMVGEVVSLGSDRPAEVVVVSWSNPTGRKPERDDLYKDGDRIGVEWKHMTMSSEEQRHWTARMIAGSTNDIDGWVEFQEIAK